MNKKIILFLILTALLCTQLQLLFSQTEEDYAEFARLENDLEEIDNEISRRERELDRQKVVGKRSLAYSEIYVPIGPTELIERLRNGDKQVLVDIRYRDIIRLIEKVNNDIQTYKEQISNQPRESLQNREEFIDIVKYVDRVQIGRFTNYVIKYFLKDPQSEKIRQALITSGLGGIRNPDPIVRLFSTYLLRRLIPESSMREDVKFFLLNKSPELPPIETVQQSEEIPNIYEFFFLDKKKFNLNPYNELAKLHRFISRSILVDYIVSTPEDTEFFKEIGINSFRLLSNQIDSEGFFKLPINYFDQSQVDMLVGGFENKNTLVREEIITTLIRILRARDTSNSSRKKIFAYFIDSPYRNRLVVGLSDEDLDKISIRKLVKAYIIKVGEVDSDEFRDNDLYDQEDDINYERPDLTVDPLFIGEDGDVTLADLEIGEDEEAEELADLKNEIKVIIDEEDEIEVSEKEQSDDEKVVVINLGSVLFEFNKTDLEENTVSKLNKVIDTLKKYDTFKLKINGHTDSIGKEDINQEYSKKRAENVATYLIKQGVDENRITVKGWGFSKPIATNKTKEGRAKNRRVEIVIMTDNGDDEEK